MVSALLEAGADSSATDNQGDNAIDEARAGGHDLVVATLQNATVAQVSEDAPERPKEEPEAQAAVLGWGGCSMTELQPGSVLLVTTEVFALNDAATCPARQRSLEGNPIGCPLPYTNNMASWMGSSSEYFPLGATDRDSHWRAPSSPILQKWGEFIAADSSYEPDAYGCWLARTLAEATVERNRKMSFRSQLKRDYSHHVVDWQPPSEFLASARTQEGPAQTEGADEEGEEQVWHWCSALFTGRGYVSGLSYASYRKDVDVRNGWVDYLEEIDGMPSYFANRQCSWARDKEQAQIDVDSWADWQEQTSIAGDDPISVTKTGWIWRPAP